MLANTRRIIVVTVVATIVIGGAVVTFSFAPGGPSWTGLGTGLAVGGGGLAFGSFLGLLFGVPRSLQAANTLAAPAPAPAAAVVADPGAGGGGGAGAAVAAIAGSVPAPAPAATNQPNTNLTEISDWLTKIMVGVSLTQLGTIRSEVVSLVNALAPGFGGGPAAVPFVGGLVTLSTLTGFLAGYLLSRIFLPSAFNDAESRAEEAGKRGAKAAVDAAIKPLEESGRRAAEQAVQAAVQPLAEASRQAVADTVSADADAIRVVEAQLNPGTGTPPPSQSEIDAALAKTSAVGRANAFVRAHDVRTLSWKDDPERMARTIPIFRALLATDDGDKHRNHAQLGYALKDKRPPEDAEAVKELTKAIDLRDAAGESGYLMYELNRALANIELERAKGTDKSTKERRDAIMGDLRKAAANPRIKTMIATIQTATDWMDKNGVGV